MKLALMAHDEEDLAVISAHLQDAVGVMGEMTYLPRERRFVMLVNRFVWEEQKGKFLRPARPMRARTGIHFDHITHAQLLNLPQREADFAFELLAVRYTRTGGDDDPAGIIELDFAGGGSIRLTAECIECWLTDISEPWIVKSKPLHPQQ